MIYHILQHIEKSNIFLTKDCLSGPKMEITEDGKKFSLFKSVFKLLNIKYEYNNLVVEAEYNIDPIERVSQKLFSLG